VTNGGAQYRSVETYPYSAAILQPSRKPGRFAFDSSGIAAMVAEAGKTYGAEDKYFLTGWKRADTRCGRRCCSIRKRFVPPP